MTLVEVLVAGSLIALVVGALCEMYLVGQKLAKRVGAQATAWQMANLGMERMAAIIEQGVSATVVGGGGELEMTLPIDRDANGNYLPRLVGAGLAYGNGEMVRFYCANSGGVASGDILWLARKPVAGAWTPDAEWSLTPGTTQGRVQPVSSLSFVKVNDCAVTATIAASEPYGDKSASATLTRTIYLRNHN
jgi:hypothetical protein